MQKLIALLALLALYFPSNANTTHLNFKLTFLNKYYPYEHDNIPAKLTDITRAHTYLNTTISYGIPHTFPIYINNIPANDELRFRLGDDCRIDFSAKQLADFIYIDHFNRFKITLFPEPHDGDEVCTFKKYY